MKFAYSLLLRLPDSTILNLIRRFNWVKLLQFSLVSSRARQLVASLNRKTNQFNVYIENDEINISVSCNKCSIGFEFYKDKSVNDDLSIRRELLPPRIVYAKINNNSYKLHREGFELKDWVDHLLFIFNTSKVNECYLATNKYDFHSLSKTFDEIETFHLDLPEGISDEDALNAFKTSHTLCIDRSVNEEEKFHKILMRNYTCLNFMERTTLTLNDLLTINTSYTSFFDVSFTEKVLNRFLKHWIKGSNPQLVGMFFNCILEREFEMNQLLKGIDNKVTGLAANEETPNGNFVIKRFNGTRATLKITLFPNAASILMIVPAGVQKYHF
ncbi:hypothetical protein CRE_29345 [Caenorhabditis remanei]|uniref:F-box domain-containing protein n=1 Tax=Caenorhabditis remanei TaxID=31234 RepID=E3MY02_CAERE|nr:hypothetical protein CRE_29345 [Caenorhabditis remanei]